MTRRRLMRNLYNFLDVLHLRLFIQKVTLKHVIEELEDEN